MPGSKKNFIGLEGFIWWIGVVEDRNDPEQLGRVRVRCFGWHTEDKNKIPTDALPWAHPVIPVNNPSTYTPKEGDMVFGFFIDGDSAQHPAIVGVLPGKPEAKPNYENGFSDPRTDFGSVPKKPDDAAEAYPKSKYIKEQTTNRLARGKSDSTVISTRNNNRKTGVVSAGGVTWDEPVPAFNPTYPYNNALETESGHALEFDDTLGQERVHLAHRKGTFIEIDKDGNEVHKIVKDGYSLVMGSNYVYVSGKCSVTIGGDCNLKVGGDMNIEVVGSINMSANENFNIKGKKVSIESTSDMNIKSAGVGNLTSKGKLSLKGGPNATLQGDIIDLPAAQINMQSGSGTSASGTGLGDTTAVAKDAAPAVATASQIFSISGVPNISSITDAAAAVSSISSGVSVVKDIAGKTSTISNAVNAIKNGAANIRSALDNKLPFVELQNKVTNFEFTINNLKGDILSLPNDLKSIATSQLTQIVDEIKSYPQSLKFAINDTLEPLKAQADAAKNLANKVKKVFGKHTYPSTETVEVPMQTTDFPSWYDQNTEPTVANTEIMTEETANTSIDNG